jgi:hypothetical protein
MTFSHEDCVFMLSGETWAQRLKRVFNIDIETCNSCGGHVKSVAPGILPPATFVRPCRSSPASKTL